ncbi:MAG: SDR family NAD(P)-dependent oxidoreductase, partial [Myxococcales bacterium]|nr:SDR family NAD(P)-dependent oxidoreductase [Myxococcales bacterium]
VDLLVNNAGIFVGGASLATPQEAITRAFDVNLRGTMNGCAAFVPGMVARGRGQVLNVASLAGWMALPQMGIYSASKAAVIAYSEVLAAELSATGVGVSLLCPSFVDTELVARGQSSDDLRAFGGWLLRGLGQSPREVARAGIDAAFAGRAVAVPARSGALALAIKRRAPARFAQATAFAARLLGRMGLSPGRPTNLAQAGTGAGSRPVDPRIDGVAPALQHMGA